VIENKGVKNDEEVKKVKNVYEKYRVMESAAKKVEEYTIMANEELNNIKETEARLMLKWFSDMLLNRTT
jgi:geranylgeranyl pyrophosphate synthase